MGTESLLDHTAPELGREAFHLSPTFLADSYRPCEAHKRHSPGNRTVELHHIVPQAWQQFWQPTSPSEGAVPGRGDSGNLWDARTTVLCPTGHRNVHWYLVLLMRGMSPRRGGGSAEARIAQLAMERWQHNGGDLEALRKARLFGYA